MGYHHLALATRDIQACHAFYEGVMGMELVKVEVGETPGGGWAKHFFYRMEDDSKFVAFWEMHGTPGGDTVETNISKAAGVPDFINHIAFDVKDRADLDRRRDQWLGSGRDVMEIDHGWCRSIYTKDPNDNLVEFCLTTGAFTQADRAHALEALTSNDVARAPGKPAITMHKAKAVAAE
ncbi:MAG: VOC family protein [Alphaproteobacteria bacterium]|nr:VOC family protein [Alphaproteobacteria bacterium]